MTTVARARLHAHAPGAMPRWSVVAGSRRTSLRGMLGKPSTKRLFSRDAEIARTRPTCGGSWCFANPRGAAVMRAQHARVHARGAHRHAKQHRSLRKCAPKRKCARLGSWRERTIAQLRTRVQQKLRNVDLDWTRFQTRATERTRTRQIWIVRETFFARGTAIEFRREHCADRTRVNRAIGVTADFAIDRARVEARAAANAAEQFALLASENPRPTRVDQNDVHFFRPRCVSAAPRTFHKRCVHRERLPRAAACEQLQKRRQARNSRLKSRDPRVDKARACARAQSS